jgi:mycoredoxin
VEDRKFICPCYRHKDDIAATGHCICHLFVSSDYQRPEIEAPPAPSEGSEWPRIVVYGASWCKDTQRSRKYLNRVGVPYTLVDVDQNPEAARQVKARNRGYLSTPTIDIDGQILIEPSDEELAEILGIAGS